MALAFFLIFATSALAGGRAKASSVYDNVPVNGEAIATQSNGSDATDIYNYYELALQNITPTSNCNTNNQIQWWKDHKGDANYVYTLSQEEINDKDSGVFRVVLRYGLGNGTNQPLVRWANNTTYNYIYTSNINGWQGEIYFAMSAGGGTNRYQIPSTSKYISVDCQSFGIPKTDSTIAQEVKTGGWLKTKLIKFGGNTGQLNIIYPTGYEGENIPTVYIPKNYLTDKPNIKLIDVKKCKGNFIDNNFLTTDEVPFTCNGGLAPVITGTFWKKVSGNYVQKDTFTANATGIFSLKLDEEATDTDYKIISSYDCSDGHNYFTQQEQFEFTINEFGSVKDNPLFANCMSSTYPFMHFNECVQNIETIINIGTMGKWKIGNEWELTNECRNLAILGGWINKPNVEICPSFSKNLRDTVTPFVILTLALGMIAMLNKKFGKQDL